MIIYKKPKDIKYTDMCIYIDTYAYTDKCDDELLYQYLYLLVDMLARKGHYFKSRLKHEDFCFYSANKIYLRIKNEKQFDDTKKVQKITNILSYIKNKILWLKIDYAKENARSGCTSYENLIEYNDEIVLNQILGKLADETKKIDFSTYINNIPRMVRNFINTTPYSGTNEFSQVYISCLLSLLNMITPRNSAIEKIKSIENDGNYNNAIDCICNNERDDFVILYHLNSSMRDYIRIITLRIYNLIANELGDIVS